MGLTTLQKRAKLRLAVEVYAPQAGMSLLAWLTKECARIDALSPNGQTIASAAGNGESVSFSDPEKGGSPRELLEFWEEIRGLYDRTREDLVAEGITSPTETEIVAEMLRSLVPVRSYSHDFSRAKCAYSEAVL